jgi:hypothetical protein
MLTHDLVHLDGQSVLVSTTTDTHNPPIARRGTLRVVPDSAAGGAPRIEIVLSFPDMFNEPAHQRILPLDAEAVARLLASEPSGAWALTIDQPLDAPSERPLRVPPQSIQHKE